ncbi:MAG: pyrroline-5-carboxylate reductase [Planctomycetes bacterium]|nr:pyrroline-5-carboxylate reductase [Planctomycetota bacterium]
MEQTIGFLGAGKMGEALARGLLAGRRVTPDRVLMSDVDGKRLEDLARQLQVGIADGNAALVAASDVVMVALKPGVVRQVLPGLGNAIGSQKLVVSIAAGVTLRELEGMLGPGARVVRVMPNTPCLVGCGASAYALGSAATEADGRLVNEVFCSVGIAVAVPEALLDAVTGLSGSGPAFVALVIEGLADGGVLAGLPRETALKLAAQTVLGTARLVLETGRHPAVVKDMVASPGGTTIEGLKVLEEKRLRGALIQAVEAAARRSRELGAPSEDGG